MAGPMAIGARVRRTKIRDGSPTSGAPLTLCRHLAKRRTMTVCRKRA